VWHHTVDSIDKKIAYLSIDQPWLLLLHWVFLAALAALVLAALHRGCLFTCFHCNNCEENKALTMFMYQMLFLMRWCQ